MRPFSVLWLLLVLASFIAIPSSATNNCTSATGCTDCKTEENGNFSCQFVTKDAFCECNLFVMSNRLACGVEGTCDYTPSSGGGGGTGGGSGGGGGTCAQLAGSWCPPECSSCTTIYWN